MVNVFIFLLLTRVFTFILPLIAKQFPFYPNKTISLLASWNWWDAPHYLYLSYNGYTNLGDERNFIVFPPFYPFLIRIFGFLINNHELSAILISNISFVIAGLIFYRLIKIDFSENIARLGLVMLSLFPTSFFFSAPYSESVFVLLTISSLFFARKKKWLWSGILGGLAMITRHIGLILLPTICIEWFSNKERKLSSLLVISLPFLITFSLYLLINKNIYSNPFAFAEILKEHWQKSFQFPWFSIFQSWKIATYGIVNGFDEYSLKIGFIEAVTSTFSWIVVFVSFFKLRRSYFFYFLFSVIMITSTGFILSSLRYLLSIPPLFILLAKELKSRIIISLWLLFSITLLILFTYYYSIGHWAF